MSEKRFKTLTIIIEDDTGTIQTHIRSELSAPQLMDKIFQLKEENEQLSKQMNRLYNYFQDWSENIMAGEHFSEMWDIVKEDESWDDE